MTLAEKVSAIGWAFKDASRASAVESIATEVGILEKRYTSMEADMERNRQALDCLEALVVNFDSHGFADKTWWDEARRITGREP